MTATWEQRQRRTDAYYAEVQRHREAAAHHRRVALMEDELGDAASLRLAQENIDTMAALEVPC